MPWAGLGPNTLGWCLWPWVGAYGPGLPYLEVGGVVFEMLLDAHTQLFHPLPLGLQGRAVRLENRQTNRQMKTSPEHPVVFVGSLSGPTQAYAPISK